MQNRNDNDVTDQALIDSYYAGSARAFDELEKRWFPKLARYFSSLKCRYRCTCAEFGEEELTQTLLLKIANGKGKDTGRYAPGRGSFSSWMRRAASNLFIDHLRRNHKDATLFMYRTSPFDAVAPENAVLTIPVKLVMSDFERPIPLADSTLAGLSAALSDLSAELPLDLDVTLHGATLKDRYPNFSSEIVQNVWWMEVRSGTKHLRLVDGLDQDLFGKPRKEWVYRDGRHDPFDDQAFQKGSRDLHGLLAPDRMSENGEINSAGADRWAGAWPKIRNAIQIGLKNLRPEQARVFHRRTCPQDFSKFVDVAEALKVSVGTVADWLKKAKHAVREEIKIHFPKYQADQEDEKFIFKTYWSESDERCRKAEEGYSEQQSSASV